MPATPAATARIAVAANFRHAAQEIGEAFEESTAHRVLFSFGSTGLLFAQITQGAPFDAFLAADAARAERAVRGGFAVEGSRFTYATGRVALFSIDSGLVQGPDTLAAADFRRLALAEPASAPYGTAAIEALRSLDRYTALEDRIVRGLNVAQAYQFVYSGSAEVGFVALSQIILHSQGSRWIVPPALHSPIRQVAVLLVQGRSNSAAKEFLAFLRGPESDAVRAKYGYSRGD